MSIRSKPARIIWIGCAAVVCAGSRASALPPFDVSQEAQQSKEVAQQTQKKLEHPFRFRIQDLGELRPGTASAGDIPIVASFPNELTLLRDPNGILEVYFSKADFELKHPGIAFQKQKKDTPPTGRGPTILRGISMTLSDGALVLSMQGLCQRIQANGQMTISPFCSASRYLDPIYTETDPSGQFYTDKGIQLGEVQLPRFWLIQTTNDDATGTILSVDWESYSFIPEAGRFICWNVKRDEGEKLARSIRKDIAHGYEWADDKIRRHRVNCAIHQKTVPASESATGRFHLSGDGSTEEWVTPIIPRRWITDEHPTP